MTTSNDRTRTEVDEVREDSLTTLEQLKEELKRKNQQLDAARANEALLLGRLNEQRLVGADIGGRSYQELVMEVERLRETVMSLQSLVTSLYVDHQAAKKRTDDRLEKLESVVVASSEALDPLVQSAINLDRRVERLEEQSCDLDQPRDGYRAPPTREEEGSVYGRPYYEHRDREVATIPSSGQYRLDSRRRPATETYTQTTTTEYTVQVSRRHTTSFGCEVNRDTGLGDSATGSLLGTTTTAIQDSTDPQHRQPAAPAQRVEGNERETSGFVDSRSTESENSPVQACLPAHFSTRQGMPCHTNSLPTQLSSSANGFPSVPMGSRQVLYGSYHERLDHMDGQH